MIQSKIVSESNTTYMYSLILKVSGWICMPLCCLGCLCIGPGYICAEFTSTCKQLIEFYGGKERMNILAAKIRKEMLLFRDSVTQANLVVQPQLIVPDITMLDVIAEMNPRIGSIISCKTVNVLNNNNKKTYSTEIWKNYQNCGGNYHIIVYGLIEYLFIIYPPSCPLINTYICKILKDSSLRTEVLSHKANAYM